MSESRGVDLIRDALIESGKAMPVNLLSVKLKWGQGDLKEFGTIRKFLEKYPDVFSLDGLKVDLFNRPEAPSKAAPTAKMVPEEDPLAPMARTKAIPKPPTDLASKAAGPRGGAAMDTSKAPAFPKPLSKAAAGPNSWAVGAKRQAVELADSFGHEAKAPRLEAAPRTPTTSKSRGPKAVEAKGMRVPPGPPPPAPPMPIEEEMPPPGGKGIGAKSGLLTPKRPVPTGTPTPSPGPSQAIPALSKANALAGGSGKGGPVHVPSAGLRPTAPPLSASQVHAAVPSKAAQVPAPTVMPPTVMPPTVMPPTAMPPTAMGHTTMAAMPKGKAMSAPPPEQLDDNLKDEDLSQAITNCKLRGMELELRTLAFKVAPSEEYRKSCRQCLALIRQAVVTHDWGGGYEKPTPSVVGSVLQETELEGCDMDVALRFPASISPQNREACMKELWEQLQVSSTLGAFETTRLFPHARAPLTVELKGSIPRTLAHLILVDANEASRRPTTLDAVIKQLCDFFGPARDLIRLVKMWAYNHSLSNDHEGYLSGVAWTLLTICFLQKDKLMPAFNDLDKAEQPTSFPDLLAMLRRFFDFLSAGAQGGLPRGFSIARGQEFHAPSGAVFIEDPAEWIDGKRQVNLAQNAGKQQWQRITEEAKKVSDRLTSNQPQRWFHWAEVFDPRERPPQRMAKLADAMAEIPQHSPGKGEAFGKGGCAGAHHPPGQPPPTAAPVGGKPALPTPCGGKPAQTYGGGKPMGTHGGGKGMNMGAHGRRVSYSRQY